ncbi:hypothetical protein L596_001074 [Steinernema carpocapsae]|uniref:Uncharacterized protein n=1 Tax=Steinernema carpocapsae TaxID=34508 RepID=A0A4U8UMA6_STECR|nr:hypothetical protein L596_001074 [Steinernema carpocapsae]
MTATVRLVIETKSLFRGDQSAVGCKARKEARKPQRFRKKHLNTKRVIKWAKFHSGHVMIGSFKAVETI